MAIIAINPDGQDHDRIPDGGGRINSALSRNRAVTAERRDPGEITAVQKMVSAVTGSLLTGLLVTPLDVVRVRWQAQGTAKPSSLVAGYTRSTLTAPGVQQPSGLGVTACCREVFFRNNTSDICIVEPRVAGVGLGGGVTSVDCAVEQTQSKTFTSTFDGLRKIARNEGPLTLWRGLAPTLAMAVPGNIIYFTGYEWLRFNNKSPMARAGDVWGPLAAGSVARVAAAAVVSPLELFRTRLQAATGNSTRGYVQDTVRGIRDMIGSHGYTSLWRGLTLTLWRDVPFSGMYWYGYETIRGRLTDLRHGARSDPMSGNGGRNQTRRQSQHSANHQDTFTDSFIAGATSGAFASIMTMPFDVGKTRTQVFQDTGKSVAGGAVAAAPEEQSMAKLLWHIFKTEGTAGLFRGWIPRTLKVAPACAIMISSYEVGKKVFRGVNEREYERKMQLDGQEMTPVE